MIRVFVRGNLFISADMLIKNKIFFTYIVIIDSMNRFSKLHYRFIIKLDSKFLKLNSLFLNCFRFFYSDIRILYSNYEFLTKSGEFFSNLFFCIRLLKFHKQVKLKWFYWVIKLFKKKTKILLFLLSNESTFSDSMTNKNLKKKMIAFNFPNTLFSIFLKCNKNWENLSKIIKITFSCMICKKNTCFVNSILISDFDYLRQKSLSFLSPMLSSSISSLSFCKMCKRKTKLTKKVNISFHNVVNLEKLMQIKYKTDFRNFYLENNLVFFLKLNTIPEIDIKKNLTFFPVLHHSGKKISYYQFCSDFLIDYYIQKIKKILKNLKQIDDTKPIKKKYSDLKIFKECSFTPLLSYCCTQIEIYKRIEIFILKLNEKKLFSENLF